MNIIGYLDKFSYKSGEIVNCKVSSILNKDYKVEFIQIIQGDVHPKAPGYKIKKIKLDCFNKKVFKGRKQNLHSGSYAKVNIQNLYKCNAILKSGRNKGKQCNNNCKNNLYCGIHKNYIKDK